MKKCAIVLAAGEGKRMKSSLPKTLHKVCGKEMVNHVIDNLKKSDVYSINVVVGVGAEKVKENTKIKNVEYSLQEEQLGTGHAVMCSKEFLMHNEDLVIIVNGDAPLITSESITKVIGKVEDDNLDGCIVTAILSDAHEYPYGKVIKENNNVIRIKEFKDCSDEEKNIEEINVGVYVFKIELLLEALKLLNTDNVQGEYYLTDVVEILSSKNKNIQSVSIPYEEMIGVNSRIDLAMVENLMKERINEMHMENGVTIIDPKNCYIGADVTIGSDVIIYPNNILEGKTSVANDVLFMQGNRVSDSEIGQGSVVQNSVIVDSEIGKNVNIGPFAYIRPGSVIENGVKVGDFVEIKKSRIGKKTKISHLTYIGDADVGDNCNFGCGTVVVNYDGSKKHKTIIGNNVFVGCNTNLVSPVVLEDNTYTAAGSTITENVPEKSLAIARAKQVNINGWVDKKKNKK